MFFFSPFLNSINGAENVLVGIDGYLKLTDLGFAKVVPEKTYTLCGTPGEPHEANTFLLRG